MKQNKTREEMSRCVSCIVCVCARVQKQATFIRTHIRTHTHTDTVVIPHSGRENNNDTKYKKKITKITKITTTPCCHRHCVPRNINYLPTYTRPPPPRPNFPK